MSILKKIISRGFLIKEAIRMLEASLSSYSLPTFLKDQFLYFVFPGIFNSGIKATLLFLFLCLHALLALILNYTTHPSNNFSKQLPTLYSIGRYIYLLNVFLVTNVFKWNLLSYKAKLHPTKSKCDH